MSDCSPDAKGASFDDHWGDGWPDPEHVEKCLRDPGMRATMFTKGRDGGSFSVDGLYDTEGLPPRGGLVSAALYMYMNPESGVTLQYFKWDGRVQKSETFHSRGNLSLLNQFVRSLHGTPLSLGLFIPFEGGAVTVKQFLDSDGELPTVIDWVRGSDLPPETFPER